MTEVDRRFRTLQFLLRAVCDALDISLKIGDNWHFSPDDRSIYVSSEIILNNNIFNNAWILMHEIGHIEISRYHKFCHSLEQTFPWGIFFNSLEEERVNRWMINLYPPMKDWYDHDLKSMHSDMSEVYPLLRQFNYGCVAFWNGMSLDSFCPDVAQSLMVTRESRAKYITTVPNGIAEGSVCRDKVRGNARLIESEVMSSARSAFDLAMTEIFPVALKLFSLDVAKFHTFMKSKPDLWKNRERLSQTLSPKASLGLVHGSKGSEIDEKVLQGKECDPHVLKIYLTSFDMSSLHGLKAGKARGPGGMKRVIGSSPRGVRPFVPKEGAAPDYAKIVQALEPQIESLRQDLGKLIRRSMNKLSGRFSSGPKVDLRAAMQFEAGAGSYDRLWKRRQGKGGNVNSAFLLLVDLSGSMAGSKINVAIQGAILMVETLARIGVPVAVYGFQDLLLKFKGFADGARTTISEMFTKMFQEVEGNCPGGNNKPIYNDDGPCLLEAAKLIGALPVQQKVLIVISDGHPEGRESNSDDLHRAVKMVSTDPSINLIGIGLGPNTKHVRQYYPDAVANVETEELSAVLGRCLRHHLGGSNEIVSREVVIEETPF